MQLLDALFGSLCFAFLAAFASQTLGEAAEAERLARAAALAEELASALVLHSPAEAELPRQGQPCLEIPLAALRDEGLLSLGFPETGPFGLRWQALICQPRSQAAGADAAASGGTGGGQGGGADAPASSGAAASSGQGLAPPQALACLVLPAGAGGEASAGAGPDAQDAQGAHDLPGAQDGTGEAGKAGQASARPAQTFCRALAARLPGAFVLDGAVLAAGHGASFTLDLAGLGAHSLAASAAGAGLAVPAGGAWRSGQGSSPASAFLQRDAQSGLPEGASMETALSLGGHSLAEVCALQFVPLTEEAVSALACADAGDASAMPAAEAGAATDAAGGGAHAAASAAGSGDQAGAASSAMAMLERACAGPGADGLLAFEPEQGLFLCTQGQPALVHDAGNTLAFAAIGFDPPDADQQALCPRGTSPEHFTLPAVFEADDSTPAFAQLQSDLASRCGASSRYGMADYFCGLAPQGRTLQIWQALAKKRVWWDEEDEFQALFGGFFGEADLPWSRARYDRELCQACRGGGFSRRMVAADAGEALAGSPRFLHAYQGREDMMPLSTVGGVPASAGLVHFTLCRPR